MEIVIVIFAVVLCSIPLLVKVFGPKRETKLLPGVAWRDPSRHVRLSPFLHEFGYDIEPSQSHQCVFKKEREDGQVERCVVSYHKLDHARHRFLVREGDLTKRGHGGEIIRFDFEIETARHWPEPLSFALGATGDDARRYFADAHAALEVVDRVDEAACRGIASETYPEPLSWPGQSLLDLLFGTRSLELKRLGFYGDWIVTSAMRRDVDRIHVTFHLSTVGLEVLKPAQSYRTMFEVRDRVRDRLSHVKIDGLMERAYEMLSPPFDAEHARMLPLAMMIVQTLSRSHPRVAFKDHDRRVIRALDDRPGAFALPRIIEGLSEAQCRELWTATLIELIASTPTPELLTVLRTKMSTSEMLAEHRIPAELLYDEIHRAWTDASPAQIVRDAEHVSPVHSMTVLSYCVSAEPDDLSELFDLIAQMVRQSRSIHQPELLGLLVDFEEALAPIRDPLHILLLELLEEDKWDHAGLVQHILLATDQLPPLQLRAWRESVSMADTEAMRDMLAELDMSDEGVMMLWGAFGAHEPHYEALAHDTGFREGVVRRTIEVCEQEGELTAQMALALAQHAAAWLSYEEDVFGESSRFGLLRDAVRALIARLEEAKFDPEVMKHLAGLTDRLPPSMTSMVSKAVKRWERDHAAWSQGALTYVDSSSEGALTLEGGQESRSASPEE